MCLDKQKVERIVLISKVEVIATILPEVSDFRFGMTHWILRPENKGTHLFLEVEVEPDFWIPPLIGPPVVKAIMRKESTKSTQLVEHFAKETAIQ